ncbi:hypothetical protein NX059_007427 [Plenodomus lindquistii]|nr:hypothetical protein NX059_007427 [Plenodomus lindquistii]
MDGPSVLTSTTNTPRLANSGQEPFPIMEDTATSAPAVPSTPETASYRLQRDDASLSTPKPHPCSARNLLLGVFKKSWERPPTPERLHKEHAKGLLKTPIGRDFNLITAAGVEFKIHSIMLIGGSKMLQDGLFPGGEMHPDPPKHVNLPPNFHPILTDRIVNFIYTSDYDFDTSTSKNVTQLTQENFNFHNCTFIPDAQPPAPATVALAGVRDFMFHLHIYALGEELQYPSLLSAAHAKLIEILIRRHNRSASNFKDIIEAVFSAPGSPSRICVDEEGILQQLVIAAVIAHECKSWGDKVRADFAALVQGPEYTEFWNAYNVVKGESEDLIKAGDVAKELGRKRKAAKQERQLARRTGSGLNFGAGGSPLRMDVLAAGNRRENGHAPRQRNRVKKRHGSGRKAGVSEKEDGEMEMD